jgi:hypothetical protein
VIFTESPEATPLRTLKMARPLSACGELHKVLEIQPGTEWWSKLCKAVDRDKDRRQHEIVEFRLFC